MYVRKCLLKVICKRLPFITAPDDFYNDTSLIVVVRVGFISLGYIACALELVIAAR